MELTELNGIEYEEDKYILRQARSERKIRQIDLADKLGIKQNSLSTAMGRQRMSLSVFRKILDALDYDVVIVDRKSGEAKWKVDGELEL